MSIISFSSNIIVAQNYIGLNVGVAADKITLKDNSYYITVTEKGYSIYHVFYGLRFESNFTKHLGLSLNSNIVNYKYGIDRIGIVPIEGFQYQGLRSSMVLKFSPIKQLYIGVGINTLYSRESLIFHFNANVREYSDFELRNANTIYVLGTQLNHFLFEFYWINKSFYSKKYDGRPSPINPPQSIGVSVSYLFQLLELKKKKGVDCPKF